MKEIILYILALIALLAIVVFANHFANKVKIERCEKAGGTIVLNVSNSDITSCIIPPRK